MRALAIVALFAGAAGCVLPGVDLSGRPCPCGPGWTCVSNVCVQGQRDAAIDAPSSIDAAVVDATVDASRDAGNVLDAAIDAAIDAGIDSGRIMPDGGPGPTRCDDLHAGAIFCDGFEFDYPASRGGWQWDLLTTGTIDTVGTPAPQLGVGALRASTDSAGGRAAIGMNFTPGIVDGDLWLRGFYYLPTELTVDAISLLYMGADDGSQGISFQMYDGGVAAVWVGTAASGAGEWHGSTTLIPRATWACLELHVVVDDVAGVVEIYVDDALAGSFSALDTVPLAAGGFAGVEAGIEYSAATQIPATLYVDEVVLSRTRVGCD